MLTWTVVSVIFGVGSYKDAKGNEDKQLFIYGLTFICIEICVIMFLFIWCAK